VGTNAGAGVTTGANNVMLGHDAGYSATGSSNIYIGWFSGWKQTTESNTLMVDNQQRADKATGVANAILVGTMAATAAGQTLNVNAKLGLASIASYTCDATTRGQFNYIAGGTGVKDIVQVCAKDGADAYAWRAIY
jgi:hypothetical protein